MTYDPRLHHRRSIRLRGYDYAGGGAYFVTICTQDKKCLFGEITEGKMILTEAGSIVQRTWDTLPQRFRSLVLDASQIMPNHFHAIFVLPGQDWKRRWLWQLVSQLFNHPPQILWVGCIGMRPAVRNRRQIARRGGQALPLRAAA